MTTRRHGADERPGAGSAAQPAAASPSGVRVLAHRYHLINPIGRGTMGVVWEAYDLRERRKVAVKEVLLPTDMSGPDRAVARERAAREARAISALRHPSIISFHDLLEEAGHPWVVMELVPSRSLAEVVRQEGPLPPGRLATIGLAVLSALEAAHAAGITHRDVKPSNILLTEDGRVKLTDFGIARAASDSTITGAGLLVGSPSFIAPEIIQGGPCRPAADLWGLGATLFAAVEGQPPFEAGEPMATLQAVVSDPTPAVPHAGPLAAVIEGLLQKQPRRRLRTVQARHLLLDAARTCERTPVADAAETQVFAQPAAPGAAPWPPPTADAAETQAYAQPAAEPTGPPAADAAETHVFAQPPAPEAEGSAAPDHGRAPIAEPGADSPHGRPYEPGLGVASLGLLPTQPGTAEGSEEPSGGEPNAGEPHGEPARSEPSAAPYGEPPVRHSGATPYGEAPDPHAGAEPDGQAADRTHPPGSEFDATTAFDLPPVGEPAVNGYPTGHGGAPIEPAGPGLDPIPGRSSGTAPWIEAAPSDPSNGPGAGHEPTAWHGGPTTPAHPGFPTPEVPSSDPFADPGGHTERPSPPPVELGPAVRLTPPERQHRPRDETTSTEHADATQWVLPPVSGPADRYAPEHGFGTDDTQPISALRHLRPPNIPSASRNAPPPGPPPPGRPAHGAWPPGPSRPGLLPPQPPDPARSRVPGRRHRLGEAEEPSGPRTVLTLLLVLVIAAGTAAGGYWLTRQLTARNSDTTHTRSSAPPTRSHHGMPFGYRAYTGPGGFTVGVPKGWTPTHRGAGVVDLNDPKGGRFLRLSGGPAPSGPPLGRLGAAERAFSTTHTGYRRVAIRTVPYRHYQAAEWEFTYTAGGRTRHVRYRYFVVGGRAYGIYISAPEATYQAMVPVFRVATTTFRPH